MLKLEELNLKNSETGTVHPTPTMRQLHINGSNLESSMALQSNETKQQSSTIVQLRSQIEELLKWKTDKLKEVYSFYYYYFFLFSLYLLIYIWV